MRVFEAPLQELVEESVHDLLVVEPRVAHAALADNRVLRRARVRAVRDGSDDGPLLVRRVPFRGLPDVRERREVGTDRDVVPRHVPESRDVDGHVVVPQPALVPGGIVRRTLDHPATRRVRHLVREDPVRPVDRLHDVLLRKMPERRRPVDRRKLLREIEGLRRPDQVRLRCARRKHRPHLVLLAVQPGDEQHLHGAAAVPVALFEIRSDASDSGAEPLHVHGRERGMPCRGDSRLVFRRRRTAGGPCLAVRPRLLRDPVHQVVAVGDRRTEDVVVAFREEMPALVLSDVGVAALDGVQDVRHVGGHAVANVPEVEVVRRLHHDRRHLRAGSLRHVDVGREPYAVAHRHHHLALDDGERLQLTLGVNAPRALLVRERSAPLCENGSRRTDNGQTCGEEETAAG